jgi:hypothetical protein
MLPALRNLWITTVILAFCAGLLTGYVMSRAELPALRLPGIHKEEPVSHPKTVPPSKLPRLA